MFQVFVTDTTVSRVTTSVIPGFSEPFEQPTFCFDKGELPSKIFNVFVFAGDCEYLPSAEKWLLHLYCILFANTLLERYVLRYKQFSTDIMHQNSKFELKMHYTLITTNV